MDGNPGIKWRAPSPLYSVSRPGSKARFLLEIDPKGLLSKTRNPVLQQASLYSGLSVKRGAFYGVAVNTETIPGPCGLAGDKLCRFRSWSDSVDPGQIFLQPANSACVGATAFTFWASLGRAVRNDGYRRMAGLALRRVPHPPNRVLIFFWATPIERHMELAFLCLAPWRAGFCRHRASLGPYCCQPHLFLANTSSRRRFSHSVPAMGQFRICPQLLFMAAQSTGTWLAAALGQAWQISSWLANQASCSSQELFSAARKPALESADY